MTTYTGPGGHAFFMDFFKRVTDLVYGPQLNARLRFQLTQPLQSTDKCRTCGHVKWKRYVWESAVCVYCCSTWQRLLDSVSFFDLFAKYLLALRLPHKAAELQGAFMALNAQNGSNRGCWGCQTHMNYGGRGAVWCDHPEYHDGQFTEARHIVQCTALWCTRSDGIECCWCKKLCCSQTVHRCYECAKPCCVTCYVKYKCEQCDNLSSGHQPYLCAYCAPARKAYYYDDKPVFWCQPCIDDNVHWKRLTSVCARCDEYEFTTCPTCDDPIEARHWAVCPHTEHYAAGDERCDKCRAIKRVKK